MKKGNMGKKGDTTEHQMGKAAQYKLWKRILFFLELIRGNTAMACTKI